MRRRLARIVPLYWAVTTVFLLGAVFAPVVLHDPFGSWPMVVTSYLFVPWQRPDGSFLPVFRLGWTLNYEMLFYVIFSAAIAQPMRRCVAVVSGFLIIAALAGQLMPPSIPQWVFWSDPIVLEFVLGMAAGQFVVEGGRVPPAGWLLGVAGLGILAFNPMAFGVPRWIAFGGPALAMLLACLVPVRGSRWLMLLTNAGAASYALYLTHLFSARALREIWVRAAGPAFLGAYAFAAIAVTLAASLLIHRCFEVPATRVARRILGVAS